MFTTLLIRLKRASRCLPALLLPLAAQAQFNYTPANAVNTTTVYTDLAATGTAIATANTDDANSAATDIGFTFDFNGVAFTQFVLNTNGYLKLGATAPVAPFFSIGPQTPTGGPLDSPDPNLILPFNFDLEDGNVSGGAEYRVATSGTAPDRVTTIQWKNVSPKALAAYPGASFGVVKQCATMDFQVKLYEGSNAIEFVYGTAVPAVINFTERAAHWAVTGLKGSSAARGQNILVEKSVTMPSFSTAAFLTGPYTNIYAFNINETKLPDAGRTFRFRGPSLANDAAVRALYTLGKVAGTYATAATAQVVVDNLGSAAQTNLVVSFAVTGANPYTSTQTVAALASGGSTTLTFTYPIAGTTGTNVLTASVPNTDDLATNNTKTASQDVTAASLSYIDNARPVSTTGITSGETGGLLAVRYTLAQAAAIASVSATFVGVAFPNTTYEVQLYNAAGAGGTPGAILYTSPPQPRPTNSGTVVTPIPDISLNAGDFFVAIKELDEYVGLVLQEEDPLRPATFYYRVPGFPFVSGDAYARGGRLALDVGLGTPPTCPAPTALTVGSITDTGASIGFVGPSNGTTYTVTYTPAGGAAVTVAPAPTASPVVLTGLTPRTAYTVSIAANCGPGQTSTAATIAFTTDPRPVYVTLPYAESFENNWIDGLATRDLPSASWRNTPATGDNSWRRQDDGSSASWRFLAQDFGPRSPYATRSSTGLFSARFHSFGAGPNIPFATPIQGKLDLYADLSGTGTKTLTFDYINPTGIDKLEVLVSTDGGTSFGATPVLTATTSAAFSARTVTIAGNSATTVIRFQASSDFARDDLGIDNLRLSVVTATRNAALAATVALYPNPASRAFTLDVPAGSLRAATATATLSNALGQVVQTRALNASGTTAFDVSGLAAGMYSLALKSGNDLVVKRVVVE